MFVFLVKDVSRQGTALGNEGKVSIRGPSECAVEEGISAFGPNFKLSGANYDEI